jgi:hypothetical protein
MQATDKQQCPYSCPLVCFLLPSTMYHDTQIPAVAGLYTPWKEATKCNFFATRWLMVDAPCFDILLSCAPQRWSVTGFELEFHDVNSDLRFYSGDLRLSKQHFMTTSVLLPFSTEIATVN